MIMMYIKIFILLYCISIPKWKPIFLIQNVYLEFVPSPLNLLNVYLYK